MQVTLPSTTELHQAMNLLMPSGHVQLADQLFAELERLRAKPAKQAATMRQVKIDAAKAKDEAVESATRMVLEVRHDKLALMDWEDRASYIQARLEEAPAKLGLPADYADTARERDIRLIRAELHKWEEKNGLSYKSVLPRQ